MPLRPLLSPSCRRLLLPEDAERCLFANAQIVCVSSRILFVAGEISTAWYTMCAAVDVGQGGIHFVGPYPSGSAIRISHRTATIVQKPDRKQLFRGGRYEPQDVY